MEEKNRKVGEEEMVDVEADNSAEESRALEEEEEIGVAFVEAVDPANSIEKGSTDLSNSQICNSNSKDLDAAESETTQEVENTVKFSSHTCSVMPEVNEQNNVPSLNESEELTQLPVDAVTAAEETKEVNPILDDNLGDAVSAGTNTIHQGILERKKPSSASNGDPGDSSSDSDLDTRYTADGCLPVSAHVEEPESQQDEVPDSKNENQMPLLPPKQRMLQPTSWKNCCGLLEFLRSSDQ